MLQDSVRKNKVKAVGTKRQGVGINENIRCGVRVVHADIAMPQRRDRRSLIPGAAAEVQDVAGGGQGLMKYRKQFGPIPDAMRPCKGDCGASDFNIGQLGLGIQNNRKIQADRSGFLWPEIGVVIE